MTKNNGSTKELYQALWNSADILRSKMDANEYKSYLLGLVFYKYLSCFVIKYDGLGYIRAIKSKKTSCFFLKKAWL